MPDAKDAEIAKLKAELEKAKELDKMKDDFIDLISHELKTPLIPILGYMEIWEREDLDPKLKKESLETAKQNANRLKNIIDNILTASKLSAGKFPLSLEKVKLIDVVKKTAKDVAAYAAQKKINLQVNVPADLEVTVDKPAIESTLFHLVHNGITFTPNNGRVTVEAGDKGKEILVKVKDTGIGIEKKHLPRLFEKFYQAQSPYTREYGGTGLGLDLVKGFIDLHKGRIWVESEIGQGTTFFFTLPKN